MSPLLQRFYNKIGAWVDAGCPNHKSFYKAAGLCSNLRWWLHDNGYPQASKAHVETREELKQSLYKEFPDKPYYPFETPVEYSMAHNLYINPKRIAWINKHRSI